MLAAFGWLGCCGWVAWVFCILSIGLMTTLRAETPIGHAIGYTVLFGTGAGIIFAGTYFPVLAPLPVTENAHALAFFAFCRYFSGVSVVISL